MKKIIYLFAMVLLFASCEKEEIGGTATESMAGEWYVHVDAVDENGDVVFEDAEIFGLGNFLILTYNTSDNVDNVMFIDDLTNFWTFKSKVDCNVSSLTFSAPDINKYVYATEYNGSDNTYNNFYYKAGNFDAEKWQSYKNGDIDLDEYFKCADDTVSAGYFAKSNYFVKYGNNDFEVGQVLVGYDEDSTKIFNDDIKNACNITITDGKILKGAATTPSGMPADSIVFYVEFDDDYTQLDEESDEVEYTPTAFGFKNYRISGYRYTGFTNDD